MNNSKAAKKIEAHLDSNPWFREPYEELTRLAVEIPALRLISGADKEMIDALSSSLLAKSAPRAPDTWFSFLMLFNGFISPHTLIYTTQMIDRRADDPDPEHWRTSYIRGVSYPTRERYRSMDRVDLGICDHGIYFCEIKHRGENYGINLVNGGKHFFNDCIDMIWHMINRVREIPPELRAVQDLPKKYKLPGELPDGSIDVSLFELPNIDGAFENRLELEHVIIPYGIHKICKDAFKGCTNLVSVALPGTLTEIGDGAFYGCSALEDIALPDSLKIIGNTAFAYCSALKEIELPGSLIKLGWEAFLYCSGLLSIKIPDGISEIYFSTFCRCTGLKEVVLPDGLEDISTSAFADCAALKEVTLPDSLTKLGDSAFARCSSLTKVNRPQGLEEIGIDIFKDTPVEDIF